jgi:hypothetical protein
MSQIVIHLAALIEERDSDKRPNIATCFTTEADGELLDARFTVLQTIQNTHPALLHSLRIAVQAIPLEAHSVTIVSRYERLICLGSSGDLPVSYRRQWREIRHRLSPFAESIWLAGENDERQDALSRCLRELQADHSLAGPNLVTPSRRQRKAIQKAQGALSADGSARAHNGIVPRIEACAA